MRGSMLAMAAALLSLLPSTAGGFTPMDHLKCYKIKDRLKLKGIVDIDSSQFGLEEGCKIARAVELCVPASKTVIEAFDRSTKPATPIDPLPIDGGPAAGDYICYAIKCRKPFPPDQVVTDQFGSRTVRKLKPFRLCTPAFKGTATTTTSTTTTTTLPPTTTTTLPPQPCELSGYPECGGSCPDPASETCLPLVGDCVCIPNDELPCYESAPQCDGPCPAGMVCAPYAAGSCICWAT